MVFPKPNPEKPQAGLVRAGLGAGRGLGRTGRRWVDLAKTQPFLLTLQRIEKKLEGVFGSTGTVVGIPNDRGPKPAVLLH